MSEHDSAGSTSEQGGLESRFIPGARIEARDIAAINVVSGVQNIAEQHIHLPGQKYVPPLHRPRRAEHFQDRESERAWLLSHLHPGQIVTICGPGGMGKTALVAEILWTLAPEDTPPALFPHGLVFHTFYGQPEAAVALEQLARTFGEDPLPTPMQAAQRALSGKHVLLVLDGAEEAENLEQVLSVCASCTVLVTSRRRSDAADPALLLDLQRLPLEDAVTVVRAWQTQPQTPVAVLERICQRVGGLPLALRLVGRYLALHQEEAEDYLAWLEEDVWQALEQGSTTHKSVPMLLARSVARLSAEAQKVLGVIGMLALAPFVRELVTDVLQVPARVATRALLELVDYGLLVRLGKDYEVSHPLIHTYARQRLLESNNVAQRRALVTRLVTALLALFPKIEVTTWADCERLVPHIQACAVHLEQQQEGLVEAASLFTQAGDYLQERGRYEQAEDLFTRAVAIREHALEPEDVDLSLSLDRLARIYWLRAKDEQAKPLFHRALAIYEKTLGPEHLETSRTLNNLALLYHDQGEYEQAEALWQAALAIKEKTVGLEHPHTAAILHNLAGLYRAQDKYEQAEPLLQRALAVYEKTVGPEHSHTAIILDTLAQLYTNQGKYEQAEALFQRSLAIKEKTLGPEHPETAATLYGLAYLSQKQGYKEQAEVLFQRALAIFEQTLPPEHPYTSAILSHYASLLKSMNRTREAQALEQRAAVILAKRTPRRSSSSSAHLVKDELLSSGDDRRSSSLKSDFSPGVHQKYVLLTLSSSSTRIRDS